MTIPNSRYIVQGIGPCFTKVTLSVTGTSVDKIMRTINRTTEFRQLVKHCDMIMFTSRKTGKPIGARFI